MNARRLLLPLALLGCCAVRAAAQSPAAVHDTSSAGVLRPGDIVKLKIWREPTLSGKLSVDEDGVVVFPMLGPIRVTQLSPDVLKRTLMEDYQRYLRNPSIEVTLLRRVTILGDVRKPGVYPVDPTMTIADALALAGGISGEGQANHLEVLRGRQRIAINLAGSMRIADSPIRSGDQLYVPQRSWLSRNTAIVTTLLSIGGSLVLALVLR